MRMSPLFYRRKQKQAHPTEEAREAVSEVKKTRSLLARAAFFKTRKETAREHQIILRPWITEKATRLAEKKVYVFEVAMDATKRDVARAIEKLYGVKPRKVTIIRRAPRKEKVYRRNASERHMRGYKKAMVHLQPGDSITLV